MIISFSTSEKYDERLIHFSHFFIFIALNYGDSKEINALFKKYELTNIKVKDEEKTQKFILESFQAFLSSGYESTDFFVPRLEVNVLYDTAIKTSTHFKGRIEKIFSNFLIILQRFDFLDDKMDGIIYNLINYLSVNRIFDGNKSFTYFSEFIAHCGLPLHWTVYFERILIYFLGIGQRAYISQ